MKTAALFAILLLLSFVPLGSTVYAQPTSTPDATTTTTSCLPSANPFAITETAWGTSGASVSAGPGSEDVPLTVALLYTGGCNLATASFELRLSQPFVGANGASNLTTYETNLASDATVSETYYVSVSSDAGLTTYTFPLRVNYSTSWYADFQTLNVSIPLKGTVDLAFASNVPDLIAGTTNEVTLSVSNTGSGTASLISLQAAASGQISILNQLSQIAELQPGSTVNQTLRVFVPSSLLGSAVLLTLSASYYDAYSVSRTATQTLGFYVSSAATPSFQVTGASWGSSDPLPQPGDRNVPLVLTLQYLGTATATSLQGTLSLPSGFTNQDGGSNSTTFTEAVSSGQSVQLTFYLNLASSEPAGSYTFPLVLTWSTASTSDLTQTLTASPPAVGQPSTAASYLLSVTQVNSSVTDGVPSTISFYVTNVGTRTISSPTFQLSASSPLVVISNSPSSQSSLAPGQTETFTAVVSASPGSTPGVYGGTLSVGFTDSSGSQHTQSFPAGFVLTGVVLLVVQDELISQTSTSLSVSGSLLNEGGVSAYYAQVTGSVRGFPGSNATAYFVGEIDPNSPVSFTITIPLSAPSRAQTGTVLLDVEYQDTFLNGHTFATSSTTDLESADQFLASQVTTTTPTSSDGNLAYIVGLAVIAAIAVVGVTGAVMVRRRRAAMRPAKEQKVI
jgi:hypothetical protein